jgi:hypothetical protein
MAFDKKANTETGLHNLRSTILTIIRYVSALIFLPALAATIIAAIARPEMKPLAFSFLIIELVLIAMAGLKILPGYIYAIGIVLVSAMAAILSMAETGLAAGGFPYLLVIPIFVFLLTAKQAGIFAYLYCLVIVLLSTILINGGILLPILIRNQWLDLTPFIMLLTGGMTLLILYDRYQEKRKESKVLEKEQLPCG